MSVREPMTIPKTSDVGPFGSGFIWVRGSGSGSRGIKSLIKWREKQSLTNTNCFPQKIIFFKSEPKKKYRCWCLLTAISSLNSYLFFAFKNYKMFWKFGDFIDLDPDWSNFVDLDPDTINPDPHHCRKPYVTVTPLDHDAQYAYYNFKE